MNSNSGAYQAWEKTKRGHVSFQTFFSVMQSDYLSAAAVKQYSSTQHTVGAENVLPALEH